MLDMMLGMAMRNISLFIPISTGKYKNNLPYWGVSGGCLRLYMCYL